MYKTHKKCLLGIGAKIQTRILHNIIMKKWSLVLNLLFVLTSPLLLIKIDNNIQFKIRVYYVLHILRYFLMTVKPLFINFFIEFGITV